LDQLEQHQSEFLDNITLSHPHTLTQLTIPPTKRPIFKMFSNSLLAVAFVAASVSAQITTPNATLDNATIASIDLTLRNQWCRAQMNTCGTLCSGAAFPNSCDGNTLIFNCTCTANNSAPALALYTETMPTFVCEEIHDLCIKANENVAAAQAKCNADEKANCGHLDPENFTAPSSSSSSTGSTPTSTGTGGSSTGTGISSSSSHAAAAATMVAIGGQYGSGFLIAGAAAAFGMLL